MDVAPTIAGIVASTLITACVLPQLVAVLRWEDVSGVSVTAAALATVSCLAWTYYAAAVGMLLPACSAGVGSVLWSAIAVVACTRNRTWPSGWVAVWAAAVAASAYLGGVTILGSVLLAEALTNTLPQAMRARRHIEGVSLLTYLMMAGGAVGWVVFGLAAGDRPLSASSALKGALSLYIVALLLRGGRPRRPAEAVHAAGAASDRSVRAAGL